MNTLFRISNSIIDTIDWEDIHKTANDMHEMGLKVYPFDEFAIEISPKSITNLMKKICDFHKEEFEPTTMTTNARSYLARFKNNHFQFVKILGDGREMNMTEKAHTELLKNQIDQKTYDELVRAMQTITLDLSCLLVVILSTKNIEKNDVVDKDLVRGRFNKSKAYRKDYPITTTITIGKISETHTSSEHGGGTVRPHLRRGHIRTQKYGPNWELSKKIFIEPVFVNADEGWIAERRAYNVRAA